MSMNPKSPKPQGPDPGVMQAIQRLVQTELSPLEEVIFQSWMGANQLEETPDVPFDYRGLYKQTDGKVFAPGELKGQVEKQTSIQSLMQAQEAHDKMSPIQMLMDNGGDPSALQGGGVASMMGGMDSGGTPEGPAF